MPPGLTFTPVPSGTAQNEIGGSIPATPIPPRLFEIRLTKLSAERLNQRLRHAEPPFIARIERGAVRLDLRPIFEEEEPLIAQALGKITARN